MDRAYAYHASLDGLSWQLIRYFAIDDGAVRDRIGFEVQSPIGTGCGVTLRHPIRTGSPRLAELRDGS